MDCSLDSEQILQVLSNNRHITKVQFLRDNDNKAIAIPLVFSKNSRSKTMVVWYKGKQLNFQERLLLQ